ncbi:acetyl-CoA carboxylase, carboxyltransferase subunit beta [Flavilitoribacter nigricans]|uniref:Acetyl-coenzyme A carboxylase carboxyl transferase subunit beta n=1 Tax=Flavilitoribacter nigricans (strain ATCC 23147 / DSM 23189 / NBRC 102662 / NCIMB 1420 / SS-2) TaxID=1122177 RepID=A0A2D0N3C6_FLAN2|nr:acetyl-CoA carboxylase, carboxyltransferase subunit beta [Flavilitoribacter nigricans]PHN02876.1 acetyl-CoA carboxylase carboxyl transferase subunit beta [Flavilitoribacter nigricans DSM 23189 = NBRC 102662]
MGWFKRLKDGIQTATRNKKEAPEGLWYKCKRCKETSTMKELKENFFKCPQCNYHVRIGSEDYFGLIFDGVFEEMFMDLRSQDMLNFVDLKPYKKRLDDAYNKTGLTEAISVAKGKVNRRPLVIAAMDFSFIGGSMGSVVGQKIAMAIDHCRENRIPLLIISKTGGARMMESAFSLMQMAKTSAKLSQLAKHKIPYFSLLTDPTTGGVTASFAMLGDINFAEPEALIGFAGPRVIKETIKRDLPEDFQTSEFLLEHGFLDFIVDRKELRERISDLLSFFDV